MKFEIFSGLMSNVWSLLFSSCILSNLGWKSCNLWYT